MSYGIVCCARVYGFTLFHWMYGFVHFFLVFFFFSSRRRHTRYWRDWSSDVCSSDLSHCRLEPAGGRHVGSVDDALRLDVGAEPGPLRDVRRRVDAARFRILLDGRWHLALQERLQLLLGVQEAEVAVEVAAHCGDPVEAPAHAIPVADQLLERRARRADQRHVASPQVNGVRVERVRDRGAHRATGLVGRPEHEVVYEQLRAAVEEVRKGFGSVLGLEAVLLLHRHPGELPPPLRELVVQAGQLLLLRQQLIPLGLPLLLCPNPVLRHSPLLCCSGLRSLYP